MSHAGQTRSEAARCRGIAVYRKVEMHAFVSKLPRMPSAFPMHGS